MIKYCLLSFFLFSFLLHSQVIKGKVYNEDNELVPFVNVYVNGTFQTEASSFGIFYLKVALHDTIQVYQTGYINEKKIIPNLFKDTIELDFILYYKKQELNEVTIEAKGIKKIKGELNEDIIDYYPLDQNDFFILKSFGKDYFISYEKEQDVLFSKKIAFVPESLFRDFLGNIHILSADSSYQLFLDNQLLILPPYSISVFNKQLKPVVASGANSLYLNRYSHHNQRYWLDYKKADEDLRSLLLIRDSIAEKVATEEYYKLLGMYNKSEPYETNLIVHGVWDGDVNKLANRKTAKQVIWYSKIRAKPINVATFDMVSSVVTLDFNKHFVYDISKQTSEIKQQKFNYSFKKSPVVLYDNFEQKIIFYVMMDGICHFYEFDVETTSFKEKNAIEGIPFPKKVKVANGYAYFMSPSNQFNKLFKMKL